MSGVAIGLAAAGLVASLAGTGTSLANAQKTDNLMAQNATRQGQLAAQQRQMALRRQKLVQQQQGQDEAARARQQALLDENMQSATKGQFDETRQAEQDRLANVLTGQAQVSQATPAAATANLATGDQSGGTAAIVDAIAQHYKNEGQKDIQGMAGNMAYGTGMNTMARDLGRQSDNLQFMTNQRQNNRQSLGRFAAGMDSADAAMGGAIQTLGNKSLMVDNTIGNLLSGLGNTAMQVGAYGLGRNSGGGSGGKK